MRMNRHVEIIKFDISLSAPIFQLADCEKLYANYVHHVLPISQMSVSVSRPHRH